jgi:hypothetical protein
MTSILFHPRFADRIEPEPNSGCWIWTGMTTIWGYGEAYVHNKRIKIHRISYMMSGRSIPEGMVIDHLCRVKCCVNPDHLEAVTPAENTRRGISPSARNARKTHCPRGHELAGDNLMVDYGGKRTCRTCHRAYAAIYKPAHKVQTRAATRARYLLAHPGAKTRGPYKTWKGKAI